MATSWQEELRQRLVERNVRDTAYSAIIEQYRRLAQQTRVLKERNNTLLRAVGSAKASGSTGGGGEDNPVRAAYTSSLESQISSMREELASMYKTQGQNAQRLLEMNDALRAKEESSRIESEDLRRSREELEKLRKEIAGIRLNLVEKERFIQELSDDNTALSLELTQTAVRNDSLKRDNASLLQRWLDKMNEEAHKMNDANNFLDDLRNRGHVGGRPSDPATNGDGSSIADSEQGFRESGRVEVRRAKAERERENG